MMGENVLPGSFSRRPTSAPDRDSLRRAETPLPDTAALHKPMKQNTFLKNKKKKYF
jgi:hypothetical protein